MPEGGEVLGIFCLLPCTGLAYDRVLGILEQYRYGGVAHAMRIIAPFAFSTLSFVVEQAHVLFASLCFCSL